MRVDYFGWSMEWAGGEREQLQYTNALNRATGLNISKLFFAFFFVAISLCRRFWFECSKRERNKTKRIAICLPFFFFWQYHIAAILQESLP